MLSNFHGVMRLNESFVLQIKVCLCETLEPMRKGSRLSHGNFIGSGIANGLKYQVYILKCFPMMPYESFANSVDCWLESHARIDFLKEMWYQ